MQQRIEVAAIGVLEAGAALDVRVNGAAALTGEQPLVEALHRELPRAATGAAAAGRLAAGRLAAGLLSGLLPGLLSGLAGHRRLGFLGVHCGGSSASDSMAAARFAISTATRAASAPFSDARAIACSSV